MRQPVAERGGLDAEAGDRAAERDRAQLRHDERDEPVGQRGVDEVLVGAHALHVGGAAAAVHLDHAAQPGDVESGRRGARPGAEEVRGRAWPGERARRPGWRRRTRQAAMRRWRPVAVPMPLTRNFENRVRPNLRESERGARSRAHLTPWLGAAGGRAERRGPATSGRRRPTPSRPATSTVRPARRSPARRQVAARRPPVADQRRGLQPAGPAGGRHRDRDRHRAEPQRRQVDRRRRRTCGRRVSRTQAPSAARVRARADRASVRILASSGSGSSTAMAEMLGRRRRPASGLVAAPGRLDHG